MLGHGKPKSKILLFGFGLFFLPFLSHAQVIINEIMYDPTGSDDKREWIEILNNSDSNFDLAGWNFNDGASHGLNVPPKNFGQGSMIVPIGGFAVLTGDAETFLNEHAGFSGTVIDTVMVLKQTLSSYIIQLTKTGQTTIETEYFISVTANNTGNSLQRQADGTWIVAIPTPGLINSTVPSSASTTTPTATTTDQTTNTNQNSSTTTTTQTENVSVHYSSVPLSKVIPEIAYKVGAGRSRLGMVGTPIEFKGESNADFSGQTIYKWSFGDGAIGYGHIVSHSYAYPGDYVVVLNAVSPAGQAISRTDVKIISEDFVISNVSPERVEVENDSNYEVNLFGHAIESGGKDFVFPEDTIIKPGQKISFPSSVTGLHPTNINDTRIAVIGDSLNKSFVPAVQIAENKSFDQKQIEALRSKAVEIQKELVLISNNTDNLASPVMALDPPSSVAADSTTTVPKIAHRSFLESLKLFFFGK